MVVVMLVCRVVWELKLVSMLVQEGQLKSSTNT